MNGIPSSCSSQNCTFTFPDSHTPTITSLAPMEGQSGTNIILRGHGFSDALEDVSISIGGVVCEVMNVSEVEIQCTVGIHSAGCYEIKMMIDGLGLAATADDELCFQYLLTVDSITPAVGGVTGGHVITFSGEGFLPFVPIPQEELEMQFPALPWFRHGFGLPNDTDVDFPDMTSMDNGTADLSDHLSTFYSLLPSSVFIGEIPCVIVESSEASLSCVPLPSQSGFFNVTITVNNQNVTLEDAYNASITATPSVESISPSSGPISGGSTITIAGMALTSDLMSSARIMIGSASCEILSFSKTHIECTTSNHPAGSLPVLISTTAGIAILDSILTDWDSMFEGVSIQDESIFPMFHYALQITGVSPQGGSAFGGTVVSLLGGIFIEEETEVLVGGILASIISISPNEIVFTTPSMYQHHYVQYLAEPVKLEFGVGYQLLWNSTDTQVTVGDTVIWNWELDLPVTQQLELSFHEVYPPFPGSDLITTKEGGLSNEGVTSETLTQTFDQAGIYYFSTTNNFNSERILTLVNVTDPVAIPAVIEVYVQSFLAEYVVEDNGNQPATDNKDDGKLESEECMNEVLLNISSDNFPVFTYSPCLTPSISSVTEQLGTRLESTFTISGEMFGDDANSNIITFGGVPCVVVTGNDSEITCRLNSSNSYTPLALTPLSISLWNAESGFAYVLLPRETMITILPSVQEISPSQGSTAGGTDILITGDTFSFSEESLIVSIAGIPCLVTYVGYSSITCKTGSSQGSNVSSSIVIRYMHDGVLVDEVVCSNFTDECAFAYSAESTPVVSTIAPSTISQPGTTELEITGSGFSVNPTENLVFLDDIPCPVSKGDQVSLFCELPPLAAGSYIFRLSICNLTDGRCFGNAQNPDSFNLIVTNGVTGMVPTRGSVVGGSTVTIYGYGFEVDSTLIQVFLGSSSCRVTQVTQDSITCVTSASTPGAVSLRVISRGTDIPHTVAIEMFDYTPDATPTVTGISPTSGQGGDMVTLTGSLFGSTPSDIRIFIGAELCTVNDIISTTQLTCELGVNFAGENEVQLLVNNLGSAMISDGVLFTYLLLVNSLSITRGSIVGLNPVIISGLGFDPSDTTITICQELCTPTATVPSVREIECLVPPASDDLSIVGEMLSCDVVIVSVGMNITHSEQYVYRRDLTPQVLSINDTRGGTEGGTPLHITGNGFDGDDGDAATVTIAGSPCIVHSRTAEEIICITERSGRTVREKVMVFIEGKGFALSDFEFWYIDVWSSRFTWGGLPPPTEGDFVVVPRGQTLLLDVRTPVLSYLLIQGGELVFDREKGDNEVELHTQGILITSGGRLEVGTEERPFLSKTQIVLYGHVLSTEIPIYGAKTLALREGEIDLHGRPIDVTWTRLAETAQAGATQIFLQDEVDWEVGGKIVMASTSFSQRENEEMEIAAIEAGELGSILTLTAPLQYQHVSVQQDILGQTVETRGEVGYLTRNIVVRGNINKEWQTLVPDCPQHFNPGQFAVQTCFQGRFGAEIVGDQFGAQIMIHAAEKNQGLVTARVEYIEVTHAGQAFRLGRYPIHFHLNGNVSGSYIRGCGIHHTFNRAVTIHAVDYLLVEKNVVFNVLGHAYFMEDGNEQNNIIQDNLGVFVRSSSSLLNVDITPATFWVVNANNILRRNAAAGGTHFGFWYRLPTNPTGPSFTNSICPRKQRVLEFANNTAHSFGWYGLWVFPSYIPTLSGNCGDNTHAPSYFDGLISWRNNRGVEFGSVGSLQLRDCVMIENRLAGIDFIQANSIWSEERGPLISNTIIAGYSVASGPEFCTQTGLKTPPTYSLTVAGVTFANFDRPGCFPIQACSHCKPMQGGFETHYRDIRYFNADQGKKLTLWSHPHEHIHRDLDGTLTGSRCPQVLIPKSELFDPSKCHLHAPSSFGAPGYLCDGDMRFGRTAIFSPMPTNMAQPAINLTNEHGNVHLPYVRFRLRGGPGYMALLPLDQEYELIWLGGRALTNMSYTLLGSNYGSSNYLRFNQEFPATLDGIRVAESTTFRNSSDLEDPVTAQHGYFAFDEENNILSYILKGPERQTVVNTFRCRYVNCIPPTQAPTTMAPPTTQTIPTLATLAPHIPHGRPNNVLYWSYNSTWPSGQLPMAGENVTIPHGQYIIMDIPDPPRLVRVTIEGVLEVLDNVDRTIEAELITIYGGRFVAGYPDAPFQHRLRIVLHGNESMFETSQYEYYQLDTRYIGVKEIAVFGELILHSEPLMKSWSLLSQTVNPGENTLILMDSVNWGPGDQIVITSTSFDAFESEVFEVLSASQDMLTINGTFRFTHLGETGGIGSVGYTLRAEVGLLSRRITIENGDPEVADDEGYGCRVFVTNTDDFKGKLQLYGVEFKGCGHLGSSDEFGPRFALSMHNTGRQQRRSYVRQCSFHDGYNTALGLLGTDYLEVTDNVIHGTVGPSMIITGADHTVMRNLASLAQFPGTYRTNDPDNPEWTANYEIAAARRIQFTHNHAAGGGKVGIHTDGEECKSVSSSTMRHNVAHSSLHGFHVTSSDGFPGCSRFVNLMAYGCYHYGFFSYSGSGVELQDSIFVNNKAAVYISVIGPSALSHVVGKKTVLVKQVQIISAGVSFDCGDDAKRPQVASHKKSFSGIQTPSGGHVGIVIPTFLSGSSGYSKTAWSSIHTYPAIGGLTNVESVSFANFANRCGSTRDLVLLTNNDAEDATHPIHLRGIMFMSDNRFMVNGQAIQSRNKAFVHVPNLGSVNPSDCVDMDCDGFKHVVIRDLDGSFTEQDSPRSLISVAEFEWGGDRRRGIGDFRIPKTMLTMANGSRIPIDEIYPVKGIVRGKKFGDQSQCQYNPNWRLYECSELSHLMLVLESLDQDTETRRLSPIGIGSNGFIDLLNGPMDNGWCGGYTCQERISTFYGIVAESFTYTIGLTSTNPQNMAIHLLNSGPEEAIVIRVINTNPQRLDVYVTRNNRDNYVPPNNARVLPDGNLEYLDEDLENFFPLVTDPHGTNVYDRNLKQLHINIRGSETYKIITTPIIMLSLTISTTVDRFFDEEVLVRNLVLLLNIPPDKVRIVDVVRETQNRRRRRLTDGSAAMDLGFEIGDSPPPAATCFGSNGMDSDGDNTAMNVSAPLNITQLNELTEMVSVVIQTGEILGEGNADVGIVSALIQEPVPPPVDPTGGIRATEDTGGPQPEDVGPNSTILTFYERQRLAEEVKASKSSSVFRLSIPSHLIFTQHAVESIEGVPLSSQLAPIITMLDNNGEVSETLGVRNPWQLRASIASGPAGSFLRNGIADFVDGHATFEGLIFSHPGTYLLHFSVSFPANTNYTITSQEAVTVMERHLDIAAHKQPQDGNALFELRPYPTVRLYEEGVFQPDHTWRGLSWYVVANLVKDGSNEVISSWRSELISGEATFTDIAVEEEGAYRLQYRAETTPQIPTEQLPEMITSDPFTITLPQFTRLIVTYDADFDIISDRKSDFIEAFEEHFVSQFPGSAIFGTNATSDATGRCIIVATFVTARDIERLIEIIVSATSDPETMLGFTFNNELFMQRCRKLKCSGQARFNWV